MAYALIPPPGSRLGPCAAECQHKDCAKHRTDADRPCVFCELPIGYNVPMAFHSLDDAPAHWKCIETKSGAR